MRMTDVITKLREVNPKVQALASLLDHKIAKTVAITRDASAAHTDEGRKVLTEALVVATMDAKLVFDGLTKSLLELNEVEKSYTRVFESAPAPAKEDERQPCLPGLEPGGEAQEPAATGPLEIGPDTGSPTGVA